jgi:hypothetical protein
MAPQSSLFHPSALIKAQASNRRSVTSGASNADSRNPANKDGANNRSSGVAGIHTSGASKDDTRNNGMAYSSRSGANKGDTRNSGMADANNRSGASTLWRPL